MANPRYAKPTDEIGHTATVTLPTGTADANYPLANVYDFRPDKVFLTTTTGAVDILWDHGAAVDLQMFSLHHYNIPAGHAGVKFQRNATDSWGAPTMDAAVTIPTYPNPGLPLPIAIDLTAVSGYASLRYSRLHIPTPTQKTGIGSALLWTTKRADFSNVRFPVTDGEQHPTRVFRTAYGSAVSYRMGARLRRHPTVFKFKTDAEYAAFLALFRSCQDGSNAFLWWRDASTSDAMLARFSDDDLLAELPVYRVHSVTMLIEELAAGPAIPTA